MTRSLAAAALLTALNAAAQSAPDPLPGAIAAEKFERLHRMLVPSPAELAGYWDLPWSATIHETREKAAAQDKPILAYFGANGSSLGAT